MAKSNKNEISANKEIGNIEEQRFNVLSNILTLEGKILRDVQNQLDSKQDLLVTEEALLTAEKKGRALTKEEWETLLKSHKTRKDSLAIIKDQTKAQQKYNQSIEAGMNAMKNGMSSFWKYLMESDKTMKEMSLEFGLTAGKAGLVRDALENSAVQAARLGVSIKDTTEMYKAYVDQVGRVVTLGDNQLIAMTQLAKGTGLANTEAASLAGQFEMMGMDLVNTVSTVEGIMETTERMGVNTTKVLKSVGSNFKKLQTYTFSDGVAGMANLAANAEKFKIDIDSALGAAQKFRKLDNVVEGAAQLQVLGGEFAKLADPMQMFYESRNDLEGFNDRIGKMTKGMATMVKTSEGFKLDIASPQARDMLEKAGEALGFSVEQMTEMAKQQYKINTLRRDMMGSGYNKEQKDMIEGMSQLNTDTGKFYVMIGNKKRDIVDLSAQELKLMKGEQQTLEQTLEQRAKAAQTFDEQFKIFGEELKAVALPLLKGINIVLTDYIRPALDSFTGLLEKVTNSKGAWAEIAGVGVGIVAALLTVGPILKMVTGAVSGIAGKIGGLFAGGGGKGGIMSSIAGKGGGAMAKNMVALGAAAIGLGAGIKMASEGISALANSFEKLNEQQLDAVVKTVALLGGTIVLTLVPAVIAIGMAGTASAVGLLAFGAAALMLGGGIGIAAAGIGYMAEGMGKLMSAANPETIGMVAMSMGQLAAGAAAIANPASLVGLYAMTKSIGNIASYGGDLERIGNAFNNISVVLSGTRNQFKEVEESIKNISQIDLSANASFAELATLLKNPLRVEFADKEVGFNVNVNLNIDKSKLIASLNLHQNVPTIIKDASNGNTTG